MLTQVAEQIAWGLIFGQLLQLAFSALQTAGQIIAMNMGLSMAVQNDPINGTSNTLVSQLFNLTMVLIFCSQRPLITGDGVVSGICLLAGRLGT